jgi:membrane protein
MTTKKRPWTQSPKVLELRRRNRAVDITVRTLDGSRRHQAGRSAAVIGYWGFLSIFPLLLVATTILGFVLHGDAELQRKIIDGALARLPIIGDQIRRDPSALHGNVVALVLGTLTSLWAGMRAFVGVQAGLDDTADIGIDDRPAMPITRLRALIGIAIVGGTQVVTATLQTLLTVRDLGIVTNALLLLASAAANVAVLALIYRWLCSRKQSWREVAPGAIFGGILFTVLQVLGVVVVGRAISKASAVYGTFAGVIALLGWLSMHATITMYGAELNRAMVTAHEHVDQLKAEPATV